MIKLLFIIWQKYKYWKATFGGNLSLVKYLKYTIHVNKRVELWVRVHRQRIAYWDGCNEVFWNSAPRQWMDRALVGEKMASCGMTFIVSFKHHQNTSNEQDFCKYIYVLAAVSKKSGLRIYTDYMCAEVVRKTWTVYIWSTPECLGLVQRQSQRSVLRICEREGLTEYGVLSLELWILSLTKDLPQ